MVRDGTTISTYTYDDNSNATGGMTESVAFTATYDAQDRMLTYGPRTYSYNANGDRTGLHPTSTTSSTVSYDALGSVKNQTNSSGVVNVYKNDGLNRRVSKTANSVFQYHYLYDQQNRIAAVTDVNGAIQKEFVYSGQSNAPDYMVVTATGAQYRFISDNLGTTRFLVNVADGTIKQQINYSELGGVGLDTSPDFQPFYFAGGIYESNTKLLRLGARDYDPFAGRWTTKDPIRFDGGDTNLLCFE